MPSVSPETSALTGACTVVVMVISGEGEVTGATTKPGSKVFQGCVAKKLIAINFPKFSAPRMGAEYTFSFE